MLLLILFSYKCFILNEIVIKDIKNNYVHHYANYNSKYIAIYEYLNVPPAQIDTKDIHSLLL